DSDHMGDIFRIAGVSSSGDAPGQVTFNDLQAHKSTNSFTNMPIEMLEPFPEQEQTHSKFHAATPSIAWDKAVSNIVGAVNGEFPLQASEKREVQEGRAEFGHM
ncbi:hypothetical protein HAX54_048738, partial [Datura stramonium]|nr:hypothetical protein [Datura stramonium]